MIYNDITELLESYKTTEKLLYNRLKEVKKSGEYDFRMVAVFERELYEVRCIISELKDYIKECGK